MFTSFLLPGNLVKSPFRNTICKGSELKDTCVGRNVEGASHMKGTFGHPYNMETVFDNDVSVGCDCHLLFFFILIFWSAPFYVLISIDSRTFRIEMHRTKTLHIVQERIQQQAIPMFYGGQIYWSA